MADWVDMIIRKREGESLAAEEVSSFIEAIQREEIALEQASAFLMAVVLNGLDEPETGAFARALMSSGQMLRFSDLSYPPADIAETGGVGGNAALVALPIAAAFGVKIPVLGEKSLRHVGGLLDKFEAIPNFRTDINVQEFQESVRNVGMAVIGQTTEMAPAEIRMNQIRANTGTIGGVSLTIASLLARKGSVGARGLMAEIPCGSGGLAKTLQQAHDMADQIFNAGEDLGFHVGGIITDRDNPTGNAIGDSLEMQEAIAVLKGEGPGDLREVALNLAAGMLIVSQMVTDLNRGRALALEAINDQRAFRKLKEIVSNQGGDTQVLDNPEMLPRGQGKREVVMQRAGYVKSIDSNNLGTAWMHLGGSRNRRGESTDHRVGLIIHKKIGDRVEKGEPIVTIHSSEKSKVDLAIEAVEEAFLISPNPVEKRRLILETFGRAR